NGNDYWKLNFILNGVREDGTHYEFRRDNIPLKSSGFDIIHWDLGPPPLDLVWKDTDANGLPLNPIWRGFEKFFCENALCLKQTCPSHASPLADDLNDYGRCSSQAPTYDRSWLCGWHVNWFPATFDGTIASGGGKNNPLYGNIVFGWGDDDFHV